MKISNYIILALTCTLYVSCQQSEEVQDGKNEYFEFLVNTKYFAANYINACCNLSEDQLIAYKNVIRNKNLIFSSYNLEEMGWLKIDQELLEECLSGLDQLATECVAIDLRDVNQNYCTQAAIGLRKEGETCSLENGNINIYFEDSCEKGLTCVNKNGERLCEKALNEGESCTASYDRCSNGFACVNSVCQANDETVAPLTESMCNDIKSNL